MASRKKINNMKISIVIVVWNALEDLKNCLKSITEQSCKDSEVIIVDNGSLDGTYDFVSEFYKNFTIIKLPKNEGFCCANNVGIRNSTGDIILSLNSDVILENNFLEKAVFQIRSLDNSFGMFMGKVLRFDRRTIDTTGLKLSRWYRFFDRGSNELDVGQYDLADDNITGPCGCAAFYRREALEKIKVNGEYFDNRFFFLGEDFDIALRIKLAGFDCKYFPNIVCYHKRSSSEHNRKFKQYLSWRNRGFLIRKNLGIRRYFLKTFPCFFVYDLPRFLYLVCFNSYARKHLFCFFVCK